MKPQVKRPDYDLTRALYTTFKKFNNFERILVLEDDFIVNDVFTIENHIVSIEKFVKTNSFDIYSLGSETYDFFTLFSKHQKCSNLFCTQSMIYSKSYMNKFIYHYENVTHEFVIDTWYSENKHYNLILYRYYLPLICQTFPDTENKMESWHDSKIVLFLHNYYLHLLDLDKKINPGWFILYYKNIILLVLFIVVIIFFLYYK